MKFYINCSNSLISSASFNMSTLNERLVLGSSGSTSVTVTGLLYTSAGSLIKL
ncbi:hypothetical protein CalGV048 [Clostera anastomosis granulovirus A]|uniref:Uncharacterized protein n=1 Tax=Clostera anastomosis granulovirus A TaxID=1986289 RepID=U5KAT2_9BBAC|nr:hypothetical protein CalGV048 [Clostera anastomosis granulovirus Henan]AGQ20307.1 hypothetical protein CalGV048 [Clostera anastomosis granulovirus Henan]